MNELEELRASPAGELMAGEDIFPDVRDRLARNLSAARTALGLSQGDLAARAGVSRATVAQLEAGEGDPRLSTVAGLAAALGFAIAPALIIFGHAETLAIQRLLENAKTAAKEGDPAGEAATRISGKHGIADDGAGEVAAWQAGEGIPAADVQEMARLLKSGIPKNRAKAVAIGTNATMGAAPFAAGIGGVLGAAAIGSTIMPGIGTILFASIAALSFAARAKWDGGAPTTPATTAKPPP